jgi:5-methylcytosine-specific restriction endonuclease McrA
MIRPVPKPPKRKRKSKRLSPAKYRKLCEEVARRAGNRCERCKPSKGRLTVHHIIKRSQGGTDTLDNLILLCEKCHGAEHGERVVLRD